MKTLIPLSEYVLAQEIRMSSPELFKSKVYTYTNFIRRPLELNMFISEKGIPTDIFYDPQTGNIKSLFQNWELLNEGNIYNHDIGILINIEKQKLVFIESDGKEVCKIKFIEDLIPFKLPLSDYMIKFLFR